MKEVIVINFFGGPGVRKSTMSAGLFSCLKDMTLNCELVREYAKELTWEKKFKTLEDQIHVFGEQQHRLWNLRGEVDIIITDSPLPLSLHYGKNMSEAFKTLVIEEFDKYTNINILLNRVAPYNPKGRSQTFEESKGVDLALVKLMSDIGRKFDLVVDGDIRSIDQIVDFLKIKIQALLTVK